MKTMTKAEFKNFVMSGYFPTNNEDIADLQDIFGKLPYWYHISLLVSNETRHNMIQLCQKLLNENDFITTLDKANVITMEIARANELEETIAELEKRIADMQKELKVLNRSTSTVRAILHQIEVEVFD